jgi:hypothetical protein
VDLSEEEAAKALLTLDPLAGLAETDTQMAQTLAGALRTESDSLRSLWQMVTQDANVTRQALEQEDDAPPVERFLVLIECADEAQQVELLRRFNEKGLRCRAIVG